MALKWLHKTDELVTNDMKLVQNDDSDEENHKYNSKILTATLPPLQYTKRTLLKFRRETYVTPSPPEDGLPYGLLNCKSLGLTYYRFSFLQPKAKILSE